jgi:eukaryotic-like serine/threonine-protein kinase
MRRADFSSALELQQALGPEHPSIAGALVELARIAHAEGHASRAVELATRAVEIREHTHVPPAQLAVAQFTLAEASWDANQEKAQALVLARAAAQALHEAGAEQSAQRVQAWLSERE